MDLTKHYICKIPFEYLEVHHMGVYACCPTWLPTKITDTENVAKAWSSDTLKEIQNSILDGSYSHCSVEHCPVLSELIHQKTVDESYFITKEQFNKIDYTHPKIINYSFDRSCNLSCPSCRTHVIMANGEESDRIEYITNEIEREYGKNVECLYMSGTADPLAAKSLRKILTNYSKEKYPKVKYIHLHTNAILFDRDMWKRLKNVRHLIGPLEISIDAATKDTYEELRRGGNWDKLIENLKFISFLNINDIRLSMVVQDSNYMEMESFYNLMYDIFKGKARIFFKKITNWGTFSNSEFSNKEIFNPNHPEFNPFLIQRSKIDQKHKCIHNFHDIVNEYIPKEIKFI